MNIMNQTQQQQVALMLAYRPRPWTLKEVVVNRLSVKQPALLEAYPIEHRIGLYQELAGVPLADLLANLDRTDGFYARAQEAMEGDLNAINELIAAYPQVRRNWLELMNQRRALDPLVLFALNDDFEHLYKRTKAIYRELAELVKQFPAYHTPYFIQGYIELPSRTMHAQAVSRKDPRLYGMILPESIRMPLGRLLQGWTTAGYLRNIADYKLHLIQDFIGDLGDEPLIIERKDHDELPLNCWPRTQHGHWNLMYIKMGKRHFHVVI